MGHVIYHRIMAHLEEHQLLVNFQHEFRRGYSCETQLITIIEQVARYLDNDSQTDLLLLDLPKAFVSVPHQRLVRKLDHYGIRGITKHWIETWLTGRSQTVVNGACSSAVQVNLESRKAQFWVR